MLTPSLVLAYWMRGSIVPLFYRGVGAKHFPMPWAEVGSEAKVLARSRMSKTGCVGPTVAGWSGLSQHTRRGVCAREDVVEALSDDEVHLGVRDDVEVVVADCLEHLVCDRGRLQARLQEVAHHRFHLLPLGVGDRVDRPGQLSGPVAAGVYDVRIHPAGAKDRHADFRVHRFKVVVERFGEGDNGLLRH